MQNEVDQVVVVSAKDVTDVTDARDATPWSRSRLAILITVIAIAWAGTMIGTALSPTLVVESPLSLIALNPNWRHALLVVPVTSAAPFFAVIIARMFFTDPIFYFLGRWYGDRAVVWVEEHSGNIGRWLRWIERKFKKGGGVILFFLPGGFICLLAGASGMSRTKFLLIDLAGTVAGAVVFRLAGDVFAGPIGVVRAFVSENMTVLTLCTVALAAAGVAARLRMTRRRHV